MEMTAVSLGLDDSDIKLTEKRIKLNTLALVKQTKNSAGAMQALRDFSDSAARSHQLKKNDFFEY